MQSRNSYSDKIGKFENSCYYKQKKKTKILHHNARNTREVFDIPQTSSFVTHGNHPGRALSNTKGKNPSALSMAVLLLACISSVQSAPIHRSNTTAPTTPPNTLTLAQNIANVSMSTPNTSLSFAHHTSIVAHNAFDYVSVFPWSSQSVSIEEQLEKYGVRGLMLDTYWKDDQVYLCHGGCHHPFGRQLPLKAAFKTISDFLEKNPTEIITIHFEDYVTQEQMQVAFKHSPQIAPYIFNPETWPVHTNWPSLQEMINKNQRLLLFTQRKELSGKYDGGIYMMWDRAMTQENYWSIGTTIGQHDFSCQSRWDTSKKLNSRNPADNGWQRLNVINYFHTVGEKLHSTSDNQGYTLLKEMAEECGKNLLPNFFAINNIHQGNLKEAVQKMNEKRV